MEVNDLPFGPPSVEQLTDEIAHLAYATAYTEGGVQYEDTAGTLYLLPTDTPDCIPLGSAAVVETLERTGSE